MNLKKAKRLFGCKPFICILFVGTACTFVNAQSDVTWQPPGTISGASDVSTQGIYFGSWAPQDGSANSHPVNGVIFQGFSDLPNFLVGATFDNGFDGYVSPGTSDSNYNLLLQYGRFSDEGTNPATISWSGMTPGSSYLIQLWVNDGRNIGEDRSETVTGGSNTSDPLFFGSDGSGQGQFIVGTFIADNSGSLTLTFTGYSTGSNPDPQINLFQVRDITPKPYVKWRVPVTISGPSDVCTLGTYFGSWAPQDPIATNYPVSGITFHGFSDLPYHAAGPTLDNGYSGFGSPNTIDDNYNTLLQSARYSNEGPQPATFSWSGMTPGDTYLVQLWVHDGRDIGQSRTETITGGTNTSAILNFGSDGTGSGQFIIGTFVANSSGGQTLTLTPFSSGPNPNAQINLFQVRDITGLVDLMPRIMGIKMNGTTISVQATNGQPSAPFEILQGTNLMQSLEQWTPIMTNAFDANGSFRWSTNVVITNNRRGFYTIREER